MPVFFYRGRDYDLISLDVEHLSEEEEEGLLSSAAADARAGLNKRFLELRAREARWLAQATPVQRTIGWGGYAWARFEAHGNITLPSCTIYGHIYTRDQFRAAERDAGQRLAAIGTEARELEASLDHLDSAHAQGWRYGMWFSQLETDGEPGEQHIANLHPMTGRQFRDARRDGWPEVPPLEER